MIGQIPRFARNDITMGGEGEKEDSQVVPIFSHSLFNLACHSERKKESENQGDGG